MLWIDWGLLRGNYVLFYLIPILQKIDSKGLLFPICSPNSSDLTVSTAIKHPQTSSGQLWRMSLNRGPHLNSRMCLEWMQWVVERSFLLYLESLISFSLLKEEVSCQLFGRQGHSVFLSFFFFFVSFSSIQKWESWITLSVMMSYLGIPFVIQMGCQKEAKCSSPSWCHVQIDLKISNLNARFQCQIAE